MLYCYLEAQEHIFSQTTLDGCLWIGTQQSRRISSTSRRSSLQARNFIKKRLQHRWFPMNIVNFVRAAARAAFARAILEKVKLCCHLRILRTLMIKFTWYFWSRSTFQMNLSLGTRHFQKALLSMKNFFFSYCVCVKFITQ